MATAAPVAPKRSRKRLPAIEIVTDPVESAKAAGLRYVTDAKPGIKRKRQGKGFRYVAPDGSAMHDPEVMRRIRSLVIPPAWTNVWICSSPNGHLQATGRDARGRKQSRYHPRWREVRDETKYDRMLLFGNALPAIRKRVEQDLTLPGLPREKVLAAIVRLLETTFIRVGNQEYARENGSYGLTTLRNKHVSVKGATVTFDFKGKSGKEHSIDLRDRRLAAIIKRCQDLPGYELFQYIDPEGNRHSVDASDVNEYLRQITNEDFTAKDFRTWAGTVLACAMLREFEPAETQTQAKKNVVEAIKRVANRLGNTPSVCRKCYVHPAVLESYMGGAVVQAVKKEVAQEVEKEIENDIHTLRDEEHDLLKMLERKLAKAA
ncbi:MAG TPA: DNA topoisomerase IB [Acidobacteriaceae bacterium]|jgi:DNA topoisomerase-1|nr:DNA topoisomerase IB [Acidobacteriaceae bacterium]